jgi:hypothetical protein
MTPTIYLALTHDWELRGDGSGDIEEIQFASMRRLLEIYEKFGARTTFLPDVMQQVAFGKLESKHPELKPLANSWDEHALEAYRQGHDIQLHLHSQWSDAKYQSDIWQLRGDWSLLNYDREHAEVMLVESKSYLENLLRPIDANYRCIAFRGSALAVAPSPYLMSSLAALGIEVDVSVCTGVHLHNETLQLDYRNCEETFLPYYPQMDDARKVSSKREPIVCVPLNHFYGSRRAVTKQNLALARSRFSRQRRASPHPASPALDTPSVGLARVYEKLIQPAIQRKHFVSDTGRLNYRLMREMLAQIRQRAGASGLSKVPVVLTNHPKDIRDWDGIERFVGEVADANDIEFVTLTQVAEKLKSGEFQIKTTNSPQMNTD